MEIYKITNIVTNKVYIGKTLRSSKYRFDEHIRQALKDSDRCLYLYRAIRKYGPNSFTWETLYVTNNVNDLNKKERGMIKEFDTRNPNVGYNIAVGGNGGDTLSIHPNKLEIYSRCSATFKKNKAGWTGKSLPLEMRKRISNTLKGRKLTAIHCLNVSKGLKESPNRDSRIAKLKMSCIGDKNSMYGKVVVKDPENPHNSLVVDKTDARYLSGELESVSRGRKYSEGILNRMSEYTYIIENVNGSREEVKNLKLWCKKYNISKWIADARCRGKFYKNYRIIERYKK
jgi:group I intron endonuclease